MSVGRRAHRRLAGDRPGAFNPLAWQLLWVSGLFLGYRLQQRPETRSSDSAQSALCRRVASFFCWRWSWIPLAVNFGEPGWLLDKMCWDRCACWNFFTVIVSGAVARPYLPRRVWGLRPLTLIGRNTCCLCSVCMPAFSYCIGAIELYALPDGWRYSIPTPAAGLDPGSRRWCADRLSNNRPGRSSSRAIGRLIPDRSSLTRDFCFTGARLYFILPCFRRESWRLCSR